jgi:hypothetical protein
MTTLGSILYACESTSSDYILIGLTDREKGDEPRSAFGFDKVRLFLQLLLTFELRTGSSTRNDVSITEKPTSTLQMRYQHSAESREEWAPNRLTSSWTSS